MKEEEAAIHNVQRGLGFQSGSASNGPKFLAVPAYNCMKFNVDVRWVRAAASIAMSGPFVEGEVSLLWYVPH